MSDCELGKTEFVIEYATELREGCARVCGVERITSFRRLLHFAEEIREECHYCSVLMSPVMSLEENDPNSLDPYPHSAVGHYM